MIGDMSDGDNARIRDCVNRMLVFIKANLANEPRNIIANALLVLGVEQAIYCGADAEDCADLVTMFHVTLSDAVTKGAILMALPAGKSIN